MHFRTVDLNGKINIAGQSNCGAAANFTGRQSSPGAKEMPDHENHVSGWMLRETKQQMPIS